MCGLGFGGLWKQTGSYLTSYWSWMSWWNNPYPQGRKYPWCSVVWLGRRQWRPTPYLFFVAFRGCRRGIWKFLWLRWVKQYQGKKSRSLWAALMTTEPNDGISARESGPQWQRRPNTTPKKSGIGEETNTTVRKPPLQQRVLASDKRK